MTKVFVLLYDSVTDYEPYNAVEVFSNLEAAQKRMKELFDAELDDWQDEYDEDFVEFSEDELDCGIQERGDYSRNHSDWNIFEKEVL